LESFSAINTAKVVNREKGYPQIAVSPKSDRMVAFHDSNKTCNEMSVSKETQKKKSDRTVILASKLSLCKSS